MTEETLPREPYRAYKVSRRDREPLVHWMLDALTAAGARVIKSTPPTQAPFRISFELPDGERRGIVAYAFLANATPTRNRPDDEHRFQVKYGSDFESDHEIWQDEYGLYTTLFLGINPEQDFFVAADPWLHRVTRFSRSIEFKDAHVEEIVRRGWHAWERERRPGKRAASEHDEPSEVLVGGTRESFLRLVRFERDALREDPGHRQLLAERGASPVQLPPLGSGVHRPAPTPERLHALTEEFELSEPEVLDLIESAPRLKMAVRGWVAEEHLVRTLRGVPGVSEAHRIATEGGADVSVRFDGGRPITVECKNVLRQTARDGVPRLDFMRTRASKNDPCSRYYSPTDFDVVAACLHAVSLRWEFRFVNPGRLEPHGKCPQKLHNRVLIDDRWSADPAGVFRAAAG